MSSHGALGAVLGGLAALAATAVHSAPAGQKATRMANVAYVGCPSDGQLGPQPPPKPSKPTPRLAAALAGRVAYYAAVNNGVLAPRGWHCFSLYGSSGTTVLVTPDPIDVKHVFDDKFKLAGDGVEFTYVLGGTSGRFEVAEVSSRFFPAVRRFVDGVAKEEKHLGAPLDLSGKAFLHDRVVSRTDKIVRFVTPPNTQGLGGRSRLRPNRSPIEGLLVLLPEDGPDLIEVDVRLPPQDLDLVPVIQSVAETNHGDPLSNTPLRDPTESSAAARPRPR